MFTRIRMISRAFALLRGHLVITPILLSLTKKDHPLAYHPVLWVLVLYPISLSALEPSVALLLAFWRV